MPFAAYASSLVPGWLRRYPRLAWLGALVMTVIISALYVLLISPLRPHCVVSMSWSPDGHSLAIQYQNGAVEITRFDVELKRSTYVLSGDAGWLTARWCIRLFDFKSPGPFCWSADGRYLASSDTYWQLKVWDVSTGHELVLPKECAWNRLTTSIANPEIQWHPTQHVLALSYMSGLRLLDLDASSIELGVTTLRTTACRHASWSNDGKLLAFYSSTDQNIVLYDVEKRQERACHLENFPWSLTWSPDGKTLFLQDLEPSSTSASVLMDVATLQIKNLPGVSYANAFTWSPDGKMLAIMDLGVAPLQPLQTLNTKPWPPPPVPVHSPLLHIWDVSKGSIVRSIPAGPVIIDFYVNLSSLSWGRDSQRIACANLVKEELSPGNALKRKTAYALKWWDVTDDTKYGEYLVDISNADIGVPFTTWLINAGNFYDNSCNHVKWSPDLDKIAVARHYALFQNGNSCYGEYSIIDIINTLPAARRAEIAKK